MRDAQHDTSQLIVARNLGRDYRVAVEASETRPWWRPRISRTYSTVAALKSANFSIPEGAAIGLVGLNGAGKSTLLKLVAGVLSPSSGELEVAGFTPHRQRTQLARQIGVVFGHRTQLWWDVTVEESLRVLGLMYSVPTRELDERITRLADLFQIGEYLARPPRQLSLGQRIRAEIIASLLHNPRLLILDEPTSGLDIVAKVEIRKLLTRLISEDQVTVLLASHEIADIEEVCQGVMLIHEGEVIFDGAIGQLKAEAMLSDSPMIEVTLDPQRLDEAASGNTSTPISVLLRLDDDGDRLKLASYASASAIIKIAEAGPTLETLLARVLSGEQTITASDSSASHNGSAPSGAVAESQGAASGTRAGE